MKLQVLNLVFGCFALSSLLARDVEVPSVFSFAGRFERADGTIDYRRLRAELKVTSNLTLDDCRAEVYALGVGEAAVRLLALSDTWDSAWQYFVFRAGASGQWKCSGNIDFPDVHYEKPALRLLQAENRRWLIFGHVDRWGTGFKVRRETWFSVAEKIREPDLSYLLDAEVREEGDPNHLLNYTLEKVRVSTTNRTLTVILSHSIVRSLLRQEAAPVVETRRNVCTRFTWSGRKHRFEAVSPVPDKIIIR